MSFQLFVTLPLLKDIPLHQELPLGLAQSTAVNTAGLTTTPKVSRGPVCGVVRSSQKETMSPSPMRQASGVSEGALTPSQDEGSDTASEVTVLGPALPQRKGTLLL